MKSKTNFKEYRVALRSDIKITAIDINTAYQGIDDLLRNMKVNEKGKFVKKLFKLEEI